MIVILNLYRNAVLGEEIHQDAFCEGDYKRRCKTGQPAKVYQGRFFPVSDESMDFETDKITLFDGRQSNNTINFDVFLN